MILLVQREITIQYRKYVLFYALIYPRRSVTLPVNFTQQDTRKQAIRWTPPTGLSQFCHYHNHCCCYCLSTVSYSQQPMVLPRKRQHHEQLVRIVRFHPRRILQAHAMFLAANYGTQRTITAAVSLLRNKDHVKKCRASWGCQCLQPFIFTPSCKCSDSGRETHDGWMDE